MTELLIDLNLLPEFINMIFFTILILGVPNMTLNLQDFVLTGYNNFLHHILPELHHSLYVFIIMWRSEICFPAKCWFRFSAACFDSVSFW